MTSSIIYCGKEKTKALMRLNYLIKQEGVTYPGGVVSRTRASPMDELNHYEEVVKGTS